MSCGQQLLTLHRTLARKSIVIEPLRVCSRSHLKSNQKKWATTKKRKTSQGGKRLLHHCSFKVISRPVSTPFSMWCTWPCSFSLTFGQQPQLNVKRRRSCQIFFEGQWRASISPFQVLGSLAADIKLSWRPSFSTFNSTRETFHHAQNPWILKPLSSQMRFSSWTNGNAALALSTRKKKKKSHEWSTLWHWPH